MITIENLTRRYGALAAVDDVTVTWTDDELHLILIADEDPAVELWEARRNAVPLMERAFDRPVLLDSMASPEEWPPADDRFAPATKE